VTTIELKFPAQRFHATPWGRHVNEGAVEWPPSPYRLVRGLYDAWKRKHTEIPDAAIEGLLRALAAEPPSYRLPLATASHTRSYLSSNTLDPTEKSLIFDAFVAMAPGAALYVTWPNVELTPSQGELLALLLGSLNYIGRSESWIDARLHDGAIYEGIRCEPMTESGESGDMVTVACPVPADGYTERRPWLDALAYSTADFQKDRRSLPPAMRMVSYARPANAVLTRFPKQSRKHAGLQAVILGLNATVLPLVTTTVEVAEQVRVRLMGIHRKYEAAGDPRNVSPMFSGKTAEGEPLKDHRHAFILPLGNVRGRIDRVLLYTRAADGFTSDEVRTILRMTELYGRTTEDPIRVMATQRAETGREIRKSATTVVSATPFCPGRHWRKGRGEYAEFLKDEIRRECRNHGIKEPQSITVLARSPGLFEWVEFRRNRKDDTPQPGYGFRLDFEQPVAAPFSLGYGCHYGLGQFAASE
jgi:CRISPR-associated protein Csb2